MIHENMIEFMGLENVINGDTTEYVQYAIETERTLHKMQKGLANCFDPKKTAIEIMKVGAEFYCADWCGIITMDTEIGVWSPIWWYSSELGAMAPNKFEEYEFLDKYKRWVEYLENHEPIIIPDVNLVKEEFPEEYILYQRLQANSVLAVPFWKGLQGFLVLKNPKRYKNRVGFLRMLNFAVVSSINEYCLLESRKLITISPSMTSDKDVYITLFGELKITTSKGVLSERELNSPKLAKILVYLLINKRVAVSPREIANSLWPNENPENIIKNIKGLIYRLHQSFMLLSDYRLVESTPNGYQLNRELNIITDVQLFDKKLSIAIKSTDNIEKIAILKKAIELYRGTLFQTAQSEHWLMPVSVSYECRYIGAVCELMNTLAVENDYVCIQQYAAKAMVYAPYSVDVYFWLILALFRLNHPEMARKELRMSQSNLLPEEYCELINRLQEYNIGVKLCS